MSENNHIKLDPNVIALLSEMEIVFNKFGIEYYIAGAFARDIQFQTKQPDTNFRKTNDIDLAICISHEDRYNEIMDALVATGSFSRNQKETIKLHYRLGIEVDIIPFGGIEDENRVVRLTKPIAFSLQMPGFAEAAAYIEEIKSGNLILKTCSVEGIVMLKLISYNDRPQRTHDLTDIDNIIDAYFYWNSDDVYANHFEIMEIYETDDSLYLPKISAHVIGRKIKLLLDNSPDVYHRVLDILANSPNPRWEAIKNGLNE